MEPHIYFLISPDQEAHLDAWSTVYVEAHIKDKLNIPLSRFLRTPGKYLFFAWAGIALDDEKNSG